MIFSRPKELPLPFKPDLELIDGGNGEFLLANSFGKLLIFNSNLEVLHEINLARRFLSLDFSSAYKIIASANEHAFYIYDLSGEVIFHMQADYEKLKIVGDKLWAIKKQSPQKKQLEIYKMGSWDLLAKTEFADPFGESQISFAQLADKHTDVLLMQFSEGTDNRRLISWELIGKKIRARHTAIDLHFPESYSPSRKKYLHTNTDHLYVHIIRIHISGFMPMKFLTNQELCSILSFYPRIESFYPRKMDVSLFSTFSPKNSLTACI